jgi:hypothetical protein
MHVSADTKFYEKSIFFLACAEKIKKPQKNIYFSTNFCHLHGQYKKLVYHGTTSEACNNIFIWNFLTYLNVLK